MGLESEPGEAELREAVCERHVVDARWDVRRDVDVQVEGALHEDSSPLRRLRLDRRLVAIELTIALFSPRIGELPRWPRRSEDRGSQPSGRVSEDC